MTDLGTWDPPGGSELGQVRRGGLPAAEGDAKRGTGYARSVYPRRSYRLLEYHGSMLSDQTRVKAYADALRACVNEESRVIDIGTGSGLLAMLAARAGAQRVDAVEVAEVIELARRLVTHNELEDVIHLHHALSYQLYLPGRSNLLVTETLGNFGLEEGILGVILDARLRLLAPMSRLIPNRVRLYVHPVEIPKQHQRISVWSQGVEGIDLSTLAADAANLMWYTTVAEDEALGTPTCIGEVDLMTMNEPTFSGSATVGIERHGTVHGLAGTFEADLTESIRLNNFPGQGAPSWRQAFLPLPEPLEMVDGDTLDVEVAMWGNGEHWKWTVRTGTHVWTQTTESGYRSSLAGVY